MWQVVSGISVLQAIAVRKRRDRSLARAGQIAAFHAKQKLSESPDCHAFTDKREGLALPVIEVAA
jgi:hypothetical protein